MSADLPRWWGHKLPVEAGPKSHTRMELEERRPTSPRAPQVWGSVEAGLPWCGGCFEAGRCVGSCGARPTPRVVSCPVSTGRLRRPGGEQRAQVAHLPDPRPAAACSRPGASARRLPSGRRTTSKGTPSKGTPWRSGSPLRRSAHSRSFRGPGATRRCRSPRSGPRAQHLQQPCPRAA